jgi:chromosome segregation ATPase
MRDYKNNNLEEKINNRSQKNNNNQYNNISNKDTNPSHDDPNSTAFLEKVKEKLEVLSVKQNDSHKYFKKRDAIENRLKQFESNLKKKVFMEKNITNNLNEKTLQQISDILKKISTLDKNVLNLIDNPKRSIEIQTEFEDENSFRNKIDNYEKNEKKLKEKKSKLKTNIREIKTENEILKEKNENLIKQNEYLKKDFEQISKINKDIEDQIKNLNLKNEEYSHFEEKYSKILKEYDELKFAMEDNIKNDREKYDFEENKRNEIHFMYMGNFNIIPQLDILNEVTQFLPNKDIANVIRISKDINISFKNNKKCVKNYFYNLIQNYKKKVIKLENLDIKMEYRVNNEELEKLFKL